MKKLALVLSLGLVSGVAFAEETKKAEPAKPAETAKAAQTSKAAETAKKAEPAKATEISGEVVSVNVEKKSLTFKTEKGEMTWPAEGKAEAALKTVKAGEKVTIAYRANEKGEPQAATDIQAAHAAKHHEKPAAKAPAQKK